MKTAKLIAAYALALVTMLFWWLLVQVAIRCDANLKADWDAGLPFDHFDPALARLDASHVALFGTDDE